jgi:PadR family transcriptional regulator, regulatory protein AphA
MSLKHAILGFLQYKPFSGYDLKKAFDTSVRHFWPADQSQIYRTLAQLADEGWAEVEVVPQEDRPDKKEYHITEAGRAALVEWLRTPLPHEDHRTASLIQVFFAGQMPDEEILPIFQRAADEMRETLAAYRAIPGQIDEYVEMVDSEREVFFWMLTLEAGINMAEAQLRWLESVVERLKKKELPSI